MPTVRIIIDPLGRLPSREASPSARRRGGIRLWCVLTKRQYSPEVPGGGGNTRMGAAKAHAEYPGSTRSDRSACDTGRAYSDIGCFIVARFGNFFTKRPGRSNRLVLIAH